jgi:plasmid stability protein
MGTITIRRLDDDVIAQLKDNAKQSGRSMEEEARIVLTRSVGRKLRGQAAADYFANLRREVFGDRVLPASVDIIREMREADPTKWDGE